MLFVLSERFIQSAVLSGPSPAHANRIGLLAKYENLLDRVELDESEVIACRRLVEVAGRLAW